MKLRNSHAVLEQISLFLDEHVLLNGAIQDINALRLEEAKSAFEQYRDLYPHGECVTDWLKITDYLLNGLSLLPGGGEGAVALCRLWLAFEDFTASLPFRNSALLGGIKQSLFSKATAMLGPQHLADDPFLPDQTPAGFVYLLAGQLDRAISSLQAALPRSPKNTHIYGYLGDAYGQRGDSVYARICYLEALLIDPEAVDWRTFQDDKLLALKRRLQEEQGLDPVASAHWLPSYAYVAGLFRPKEMRQLEVFKTFIDEYLQMERRYEREATTVLGADLFIRGIILCDNQAFLRMVKGIDYAVVRQRMKEINPPLFGAYMKFLEDRLRPRSEQRKP
jgi:tetratricopeptide (TPR) repeat protein